MLQVAHDDRTNGSRARKLRAVAATLCVLGLVGIVWMHYDAAQGTDVMTSATAPEAPVATDAFLHAPATDGSVPSADSVFGASPPTTAADEMPPTF